MSFSVNSFQNFLIHYSLHPEHAISPHPSPASHFKCRYFFIILLRVCPRFRDVSHNEPHVYFNDASSWFCERSLFIIFVFHQRQHRHGQIIPTKTVRLLYYCFPDTWTMKFVLDIFHELRYSHLVIFVFLIFYRRIHTHSDIYAHTHRHGIQKGGY